MGGLNLGCRSRTCGDYRRIREARLEIGEHVLSRVAELCPLAIRGNDMMNKMSIRAGHMRALASTLLFNSKQLEEVE